MNGARKGQIVVGLIGLLLGGAVVALTGVQGAAKPAKDAERARIEAVVRDYILSHPEIIPEAIGKLQEREMAKLVAANRKAIETPFAGAWAGAVDGDVVLVEFFDYACGYCRQSVPDVDRLLAEDKNLKVVFRELPILSEESAEAAKASLAAAKQGRFMDFHRAMYKAGRPARDTIVKAQAAGRLDVRRADADKVAADVVAEVNGNIALARTIGLTGTPAFVVGDRILNGAVGYEELRKAIAEARAKNAG